MGSEPVQLFCAMKVSLPSRKSDRELTIRAVNPYLPTPLWRFPEDIALSRAEVERGGQPRAVVQV